jgi:hypothetical protein
MQTAGWDLNLAAKPIENGVVYAKRSDKKYAFEASIARRMFHGLSLKSYNVDDVLRFEDPVGFLNSIYLLEIIKQNYLRIFRILLDI